MPNNRTKSLKFLLQHEPKFPNCRKTWTLNQIHDRSLREDLAGILLEFGESEIYELGIDRRLYRSAATRKEKIIAGININHARNFVIERLDADFTFVFDGDCFFTQELWDEATSGIEDDQAENPTRQYYGILGLRVIGKIPSDLSSLKRHEPSLVFRKDSKMRFDLTRPFGDEDKNELLYRLGYPKRKLEPKGDLCKNVGELLHISFNNPKSEKDLNTRVNLRDVSIDRFLKQLDSIKAL
jgi:hypothetical protein